MSPEPIAPSVKNRPQSTETKWARMRFGLLALLTFNLSLIILSCGLDIEDPTPPSPPVWVEKSLPEEWPERGIDAHESGGIFLEWLPNPSVENVQYYLLYRAEYFDSQDILGDYELLSRLESTTQSVIEFIDRSSSTEIRYYYVLISENASSSRSLPSDTLNYLRLNAVDAANMQPDGLTSPLNPERQLQWRYSYIVAMENYMLTILDVEDNLVLRRSVAPSNYIGQTDHYTIPDTITLHSGFTFRWRVDMESLYVAGRETAGSESRWATFLYLGE